MTPSERKQALAWWREKFFIEKCDLMIKNRVVICGDPFSRTPDDLTGREIENIWSAEMCLQEFIRDEKEFVKNRKIDVDVDMPGEWVKTGKLVWMNPPKANKKQFLSFNKELFLAYIDKFSEADKQKALETLTEHLQK